MVEAVRCVVIVVTVPFGGGVGCCGTIGVGNGIGGGTGGGVCADGEGRAGVRVGADEAVGAGDAAVGVG